MYIRIDFINHDKTLHKVDFCISHFVYCENVLSLYDKECAIYDIPISEIYYFRVINKNEAGIEYKCYNDLDFAFKDLGYEEVEIN